MGFTSFLRLLGDTLPWAALASWFSVCGLRFHPQGAHSLRDRPQAGIHSGEGKETAWAHSGALGSSVCKLRGTRAVTYDRWEGFHGGA